MMLMASVFFLKLEVLMHLLYASFESRETFKLFHIDPAFPCQSLLNCALPSMRLKVLGGAPQLDGDDNKFKGATASEIKEETGLTIPESELIDITEMALNLDDSDETDGRNKDIPERLEAAMCPSPGFAMNTFQYLSGRRK